MQIVTANKTRTFRALHLFCGVGGGALGFQRSTARWQGLDAKFETLLGVDLNPEACADFTRLTGAPALEADLATLQPAELREAAGESAPDVIFLSPPCKGFSGLLSNAKSETAKYQDLNSLVFKGLFTALETWSQRPRLILLENVPRIRSRGAELLRKVRQMLGAYGYVFSESFHDCGELGGLAQHRKRYLLIARHEATMPTFVYEPPKQRIRGVGEVLEALPMPNDPAGGTMHRLPKLQWKTMVRLALIPAGKDWRALGTRDDSKKFNNQFRIVPWDEPSVAVTSGGTPSSGGVSVADPRFDVGASYHRNVYKVCRWTDPTGTITGNARPSTGPFSVADPRWKNSQGQHGNKYRVQSWSQPAGTITGSDRVGSGAPSVADPRPLGFDPRLGAESRPNLFGVIGWEQPSGAVTGNMAVAGSNSKAAVADPRFGCKMRSGHYGVMAWDQPSPTVAGSADVHQGTAAVADPRTPLYSPNDRPENVVILSEDGTWHRPLTTYELACLQGLPPLMKNGSALELSGKSQSRKRERIGNMVPPPAAQAMGSSILSSLLPATEGATYVLGSTGIWVRRAEEPTDSLQPPKAS